MRGVVLLLMLAGCASPRLMDTVHKPGAPRQEVEADLYACERDTRAAFPNADRWQQAEIMGFARRCVMARGWQPR